MSTGIVSVGAGGAAPVRPTTTDPRTALVREKYFSLRPKPLERWLWQQGIPAAAERVFWVHWEEGMRGGDWCSQIPLRRVASLCCVDTSTVTRAYQVLKSLDLIRREDPGRDPENPFQQATPVTEVRIPRALLTELSRAPNRPRIAERAALPVRAPRPAPAPPTPAVPPAAAPRELVPAAAVSAPMLASSAAPAAAPPRHIGVREGLGIIGKLSERERAAYDRSWAAKSGPIELDPSTILTAEEQAYVQRQLTLAATPPTPEPAPTERDTIAPTVYAGPRRLAPLDTVRLRKRITDSVAAADAPETFRQVLWAVEEGALRRFETLKAINIALKKIREGAWTRPHRMPPNWSRFAGVTPIRAHALSETCRDA